MNTNDWILWLAFASNFSVTSVLLAAGFVRNGGMRPRMRLVGALAMGGGATTVVTRLLRTPDATADLVAAACLLASMALMVWAWCSLRQVEPGYAFSGHAPAAVVDKGPYRWIRHPLYASYMLGGVGAIVTSGSWLVAGILGVLVVLYSTAARQEERQLASGNMALAYQAYMHRTGRFVPRFCLVD